MDCHSKKCVKGLCLGRVATESCAKHIDCVAGTYCDTDDKKAPPSCKPMKAAAEKCTYDYECGAALLCALQPPYTKRCIEMFSLPDGETTRDPRACESSAADKGANGVFTC